MLLWRDNRGVASAEYALIAAIVGVAMVLATQPLGRAVKAQMSVHATGVGGVVYTCTNHCQAEYADYCAAIHAAGPPPVFTPALPSNAACTNGVPTS